MTRVVIRSGGQTGVDRAALDLAERRGLPACGWCPRGGWAEDFRDPPGLLARYPFLSETPSAEPEQRTSWNVRDSHATLVIASNAAQSPSPGTRFTIVCAELVFVRPLLAIEPDDFASVNTAIRWLARHIESRRDAVFVLNVAGPRESEDPGIGRRAYRCLEAIFDGQPSLASR
jgi:hypothetical protein